MGDTFNLTKGINNSRFPKVRTSLVIMIVSLLGIPNPYLEVILHTFLLCLAEIPSFLKMRLLGDRFVFEYVLI